MRPESSIDGLISLRVMGPSEKIGAENTVVVRGSFLFVSVSMDKRACDSCHFSTQSLGGAVLPSGM